jgi:LPS sulfotransferase NodH
LSPPEAPAPPAGEGPIFVIGFQRSGTTLLQALLGAHPRLAAPPEIYFVARVAEHDDYFGDLGDDANLERALHEALNPPLDMLAECGFDHDRLLARLKQGPRTYAAILDVMLTDYAERHGKERWVEKSAGQPLGPLMSLFPDARAIHIVRDPRDVVASSLRSAWTAHESATAIAEWWRAFTLDAIWRGSELGPGRFLQVRYEDLTRDPEAVLRVVCAFVGEDYDRGMVADTTRRVGTVPAIAAGWQGRALSRVEPAREGGWKERLSRADQVRVNAVVGSMLTPLGYRPASAAARVLGAPLSVAARLRRLRSRANGARRARTPEERYRAKQQFLEAQAERVRVAQG